MEKITTLNKLVMQRQMNFGFMYVLLFHTSRQCLVFYTLGSNSVSDEVLCLSPCVILFHYSSSSDIFIQDSLATL
jgi:hypothetical protein